MTKGACRISIGSKAFSLNATAPFIAFSKENDATPGIMVSALYARAVRRVHPDLSESIVGSYIANARPMLGAKETFHNCVARVTLEYDSRVQRMPLQKQCTVFRGKTFIQTDEDRIQMAMTITGSAAQMILDLPEMNMKTQVAAVNGQIFLTIIQPFSETLYYEALLEELKEQGIPYTEYGTESNRTGDVLL